MSRIKSISLAFMICMALASLSGAAAGHANYPKIEFSDEGQISRVTCDGQILMEIKDHRLRFRATPKDENWVGSEKAPIDLGWVYRDEGAKGLEIITTSHMNDPEAKQFKLLVSGKKPQFDSQVEVTLTGTWMPEVGKFKYTLNTRFFCPLDAWYEHSTIGRSEFVQRDQVAGRNKVWTEVLDYCIEGISTPERLMSTNPKFQKGRLMYEWYVKSDDGKAWEKWPKIHIPFPVRPGNYLTIRDLAHPMKTGGYYGFLDTKLGGWMTQIKTADFPVVHEICWARFDVHVSYEGAIPPRGSVNNLSLQYEMTFEPVAPDKAREIIKSATELPWRKAPEYKMPLFSWDNRFDKLITDLPGEKTAYNLVWWASDYDCDRDDTTGFDDHYSVTIKRNEKSPGKASAWSTLAWKWPFNEHHINNHHFRLSAMVKTKNCTGSVRLGHYSSIKDLSDMYYGEPKSHNKDRTPKTDGIVWDYSKSLTGTTDWTPISVEFEARNFGSTVMLEQTGNGQSWFDNVKIEDLGKIEPEKAKK